MNDRVSVRSPRRLASSVWLPWVFGVLALLSLGAVVMAAGGRVASGVGVPTAVLDAEEASTGSVARQVLRRLDAGLEDLGQLATGLGLADRPADLDQQLTEFAGRYKRFRAVYLVEMSGQVLSHTGGAPHPQALPAAPAQAGMTNAVTMDQVAVVVQYVPLKLHDGRPAVLAAEYDLAQLRPLLAGMRPATVWLVNSRGQVIASNAGFVVFQQLGRAELRRVAVAAHDQPGVTTGGGHSAQEILAYAPVRGRGLASALSWGVVASRTVDTVQLPQTQARDQARLFALLLAVITVGVFGWMYALWLRPLRQLVHQAERLADGHLDERVEVRRYDELGLACRALERIRVRLIRDATLPPANHWDGELLPVARTHNGDRAPLPNHSSGD